MKLLLVCVCAMFALAFGNIVDLEFKRTSQTGSSGNINRFETVELTKNDNTLMKRGVVCGDKCKSGTVKSKYCTNQAERCFKDGQKKRITFKAPFHTVPKVMIGLTLIDANEDQNVRVRTSVTSVDKAGFWLKFNPWDKSITYQIGVNWMACP